ARIASSRNKREIKTAIRTQVSKQKEVERQRKFEERTEKIIKKQKRIAEVREVQLRRERAESNILQARAKAKRARSTIIGPIGTRGITLNIGGPIVQSKGAVKRKKKGPTPGLGRFRVL
ncbi:hypothetical protein LCGC14_2512300, partial [marine sediment metagenome]